MNDVVFNLIDLLFFRSEHTVAKPGFSVGGSDHIPVVPEANPAIVLIPFLAIVLAVFSRRFFSSKAPQKEGC